MTSSIQTSRLRNRGGFTLIEMMTVAILLAVVGGTIMSMFARQQTFYRGTADIVELRSQLRQASAVMGADLRGVSSVGGDIIAMTDSSIDFRYTVASSIACKIATSSMIILPPLSLSSGATLTTWVTRPVVGDSVFVYDDHDSTTVDDDGWDAFGVQSVSDSVGACPSPYTVAADNGSTSYALRITSGSFANSVMRGATLRFVRRAHYSLFRATDSRWYLGYCAPQCSSTNTIQAVAGPFNPYDTNVGGGTSGIRIAYFDQTGVATTTPTSVARISFVLRGQTRQLINISGIGRGYYTDSARTDVAVRNRS